MGNRQTWLPIIWAFEPRSDTMFTWQDILPEEPVDERRKVADMCCNIEVFRQCRSLILVPHTEVRVLTGAHHDHSFFQNPQAITNNSSMGTRMEMSMMGRKLDINDAYTDERQRRIGLDPARTVTFGTAAHMDNAVVTNLVSKGGIRVSAAVTGGIRGNGGRAGDPASFDECERYCEKPGTIVILLAIEADVPDGSMFQAMLTATQSKSCVIQELMARSLYSHRIATGSGTDQVAVIVKTGSDRRVTDCGPASDVGIAIAQCVRKSLFGAFDKQTYMNTTSQCDPFVMMSRFGITPLMIHDELRTPCTMLSLMEAEKELRTDPSVAAGVSAILQLADDVRVGRVSGKTAVTTAAKLADAVLLEPGDMDPAVRKMMSYEETVEGYLSMVMSLLMQKRALRIMEAGQ